MSWRRFLSLTAAAAVAAVTAGCGSAGRAESSPSTSVAGAGAGSKPAPPPAASDPTTVRSPPATTGKPALTARSTVELAVPPAFGGGPFDSPRKLTVPAGWTAQVWAPIPDARMEAWTPEGDLLVSEPNYSRIVEVIPGSDGAKSWHTILSDLTLPQGLAFAREGGQWVLYVGESDQIDRYRWNAGGIAGPRTVLAANLPDVDPLGDDDHRDKDIAVAPNGTLYFDVGSSSNANPDDRSADPPRATIMAVNPDGSDLRVVETGVRNGEGLAVAPDGSVWTAVNERDNIPYPFHSAYAGTKNAFGKVIRAYVDEHPPDEVVLTPGRDLGWPYCNPDQDVNRPGGSLADIPLVADSVTNPGGIHLNCAALPPIEVGLPAHSAPLGLSFLEGSGLPAPWSGGAVVAVHGSWDRTPPRSPAVLWMPWDSASRSLEPAITLVSGFQNADGSRWGRPVDAVPGPDGALYITDDTSGAVYRLVPPR
jgi:glucose/arabinose dehydrogenase